MPEICRFYGIIIFMNYNDHDPPHFHARYEDQEVTIEIMSGIVKGQMSREHSVCSSSGLKSIRRN
jgi:hypothetical protein